MVVNDNACCRLHRGAFWSIASELAPTPSRDFVKVIFLPPQALC